ncbi:MAG TPA: MFS transporter [Burkholderiales bacterium]|nr:MFS transporter [Burkholderiales bacterium]
MSASPLSRRELLGYAAFALPLAMSALPVYVHAPKLYGDDLGLPLALVGVVVLAARLLDAVQDPFLGWLSDRSASSRRGRRLLLILSLPLLAAGMLTLFHPPSSHKAALAAWLWVSLMVVQLGFSMGSISYYAIGAELSEDYHERTRVTATRGAFAVAGVLIAAAAPRFLAAPGEEAQALALFSVTFLPLLLIGAIITLRLSRRTAVRPVHQPQGIFATLALTLRNGRYRWLIAITLLSGIAAAIPGTLILFYVQDVLQRPALSGPFLMLYFLFAAAGMPLWIAAARRLGKKNAWLLGMFFSVAAFVWAFLLGAGDATAFAIVCVLSGLAYGAELAIPPSLLADIVDTDVRAVDARPDGAYFGVWQMIDKLNLALAAGIALPALGWLGYHPGEPQHAHSTLSSMYALVPCGIKLAAAAALWIAPIEARALLSQERTTGEFIR